MSAFCQGISEISELQVSIKRIQVFILLLTLYIINIIGYSLY